MQSPTWKHTRWPSKVMLFGFSVIFGRRSEPLLGLALSGERAAWIPT
jgi:hypothetical protein